MLLLCLLLANFLMGVTPSDPPPLVMPGHVTIGVLSELRSGVSLKGTTKKDSEECEGPITDWALQEVAALEWALTTINNQSKNHFAIGLTVYDSCGNVDRIIRQASSLLKENEQSNSPLLGIIALGSSSLVEATVSFLHAYDVALITTHAPAGENLKTYDNVFTTAPHLYAQIQAVLSVVTRQRKHLGMLEREHRLGVISGCEHALKIMENYAKKTALEINSVMKLDPVNDRAKMAEKTLEFIKSQVGFQGTVIVLLDAEAVNGLAEGMFGQLLKRSQTRWVFCILDGESAKGELNVVKMHEVFPGSVVVEPYSPLLPGLNNHIDNAIRGNHSIVDPLLPLLEEKNKPCPPDASPDVGKLCSSESNKEGNVLSGARATAAVKAVSSLAAAFRLVQIERCPTEVWCPQALTDDINKAMLSGLMKLSYNPQGSSDSLRYTADGRLVSSFTISRVSAFGLQQVGKYREDTGVVWTHPLPGMRESSSAGNTDVGNEIHFLSPEGDGVKTISVDDKKGRNMPFDYLQIQEYPYEDGIIKELLMTHPDYMSRAWAFSVLVICCVGILTSLYIGIYVAIKYCDGTIRGPQMLGGLLLFGVVFVYLSCILYILPPSPNTCHLRIWLPNVALGICFTVLLVKGMQLRALARVGPGGVVSQMNLTLSMIFMMFGEIVLTLLTRKNIMSGDPPPLVELDANGMRQCRRDVVSSLITQSYLLVLLIFGVILGIANRRIRRNHNEGRWLILVSAVSAPVVLSWSLINFLAPDCLEPPTTCGAGVILATLILAIVYIPKMKVITTQSSGFSHKRLSAAPSLSTIFTQLDFPPQPLQPPAPFCDPPHKGYPPSDVTTLRSCHGDSGVKSYPFDPSQLITWRDHMQESPCIQRPPAPPPPPPPVRNPIYYGSANSCYP